MKRVNHMLTEKQVEELRRISEETGLSYSEILRRALDGWLQSRAVQESERD